MRQVVTLTLAVFLFASAALSQTTSGFVGTWRLLSAHHESETGQITDNLGSHPIGFLTYTAEGRMSVVITSSERKPLSVNDPKAAPAMERAQAFSTMVAYAGRYTVDGNRVTHHVEASWMPNQAGTDLVRFATLQGDHIVLRTTPMLLNGAQVVVELTWEKIK
jgi:hypothetical protein